jgi:hypothetical protein
MRSPRFTRDSLRVPPAALAHPFGYLFVFESHDGTSLRLAKVLESFPPERAFSASRTAERLGTDEASCVRMADPSWSDSVTFVSSLTTVPAALATVRLLARAEERWGGRVVPRTSMHDPLFTLPGHDYPFTESLRVAWANGVYELTLLFGDVVDAAETVEEDAAPNALDDLLERLVART